METQEIIVMEANKKEAIKRAAKNYPGAVYVRPYKYASKGNNFYLFNMAVVQGVKRQTD